MRFDLDGSLHDRFTSFVAPDRALPREVARLTGIRDEDLAAAPPLEDAVRALASFVGDDAIVGHNVGFDLAFLETAGYAPSAMSIDTAELASCVLPSAPSYALQPLVAALSAASPRAHRALDDAEAAARLYCALLASASSLRRETLEGALQLASLVGPGVEWSLAQAYGRQARTAFTGPTTPAPAPAAPAGPARPGAATLDLPLPALFAPDGPLARSFERFEERDEQLEMAEAVERTIVDGGALVVEAGTGTGKSLAYLVPALRAARAGRRVAVSTYTTALQDQLVRKDIPALVVALGAELAVAVLKGRANYLCPRRWHLLRLSASTREEARLALKTLVWRERTESGDRAELNLLGGEQALWSRICAEDETCTTRRCALVRGGCYLERARAAAETADLVVVNHALLLADARSRNRLLPDTPVIVVDEAHHLEEVAASAFGSRIDGVELRRAIQRVAHGPLAAARAAEEGTAEIVSSLRDEAERAGAAVEETFAALAALMPAPEARGFEDRRRITEATRATPEWLAAEVAAERLRDGLAGVVAQADRLLARDNADHVDEAAELLAGAQSLRDAERAIAHAVHDPRTRDICWLALEASAVAPVLQTAPAHAGSLLARLVFEPRQAAIFTSATLAVGGSFDFVLDRFGLGDRAASLELGSPFDYRRQALLVLPGGLVDPYDAAFPEQVAEVVADTARALGGSTLVLFTAHTMLRACERLVAARLEDTAIAVLAQGTGGSRRSLLERFLAGDAVLLGTASFWEGVDVPGAALRCVVVVKLPFPVPDDPVVAGRSERYEDPFREYHLPIAALRLKQGFGRLIRTRDDRGAVVLLDRRVGVRSYGEVLLSSLPPCAVARPAAEDVARAVAEWCGRGRRI